MVTAKNNRKKVKVTSLKKSIKVKENTKLKKADGVKTEKSTILDLKSKTTTQVKRSWVLLNKSKASESDDLTEKVLQTKKKRQEDGEIASNKDKPECLEQHVDNVVCENGKSTNDNSKSKSSLKTKKNIKSKQLKVDTSVKDLDNKLEDKQNVGLKRSGDVPPPKYQKRQKLNSEKAEVDENTADAKDLSREHILQCITAIFHLTEEQLKSKNALFDGESHPVFMQVTCIRVPKTPKRQMRMLLSHSIVSPSDEVALFVCDMQKGRRKDFEPTVEHYEELLAKHGVTSIKSVIPMNQVKTEYDQFELKRSLIASYDHFLVDGRIAGHLSHLLGSHFYKKRKLPISIRMQSKDLKHEIEYALKKTSMQLHSNGDSHIVQVGSTSMSKEEIADNVLSVCSSLAKNYPGGWANIRALRIKTSTSTAIPIYVTLKNKNSVAVPIVHAQRPKAYRDVKGELSTMTKKAKVVVTPEGNVIIKRKKKNRVVKVVEETETQEASA